MRAAASDMESLRDDPEHHPEPAGPFAVSIWPILDELHLALGHRYPVGYSRGWYWASRADGTGEPVRAISPDDLLRKMRATSWGGSC